MMDIFYEMRPYELIHEVYCISESCAKRSHEWDLAVTEEEQEQAEFAYYDCVNHLRFVKKILQKRGLEKAYRKYVKFLNDEELL